MSNIVLPGYQAEYLHVRLGSLIHTSNFYFAEKIFINNYYADSFAYLIYVQLFNELNGLSTISKKQITLLGYGTYSELLLARLRGLIKVGLNIECDFTTVVSYDGLRFENEKIVKESSYIIIIVPIASTLTSIAKIKRKINAYIEKPEIISTPIVCLLVAPSDDLSKTKFTFWKKDDKESNLLSMPDGSKVKYFVQINSKWDEPQNCKLCFPENSSEQSVNDEYLLSEHPLQETNNASIIPSSVLSYPIAKEMSIKHYEINNGKIEHLKEEHIIGLQHVVRGNNHFTFFIDTEQLFVSEIDEIKTWLKKLELKQLKEINKRIVIVVPEHSTNSRFADLVNDTMFGGAATIIHLEIGGDFRTNLLLFFSHLFYDNPHVVILDDAVCTGNTILRLIDFVETVFKHKQNIFSVITLLDRSPHWLEKNNKIDINSFITINIPPRAGEKHCYLCNQVSKFHKLYYERSYDISLQYYFAIQSQLLKAKQYENIQNINSHIEKRNSYLNRIEIINSLFVICHTIIQKHQIISRDIFENELSKYLINRYRLEEVNKTENGLVNIFTHLNYEDKIDVLKSLAYPSLSLYKNISPTTSLLILNEFIFQINKLHEQQNDESQKLIRTLLKLIGKMNLNILLRKDIIKKINSYLSTNDDALFNIVKQKNNNQMEIDDREIIEAQKKSIEVRYLAAVKEVVADDEAKSYRLSYELSSIDQKTVFTEKMILENDSVIIKSLEKILNVIKDHYSNKKSIFPSSEGISTIGDIDKLMSQVEQIVINLGLDVTAINDSRFLYLRYLWALKINNTMPMSATNYLNLKENSYDLIEKNRFETLVRASLFEYLYGDKDFPISHKISYIGKMLSNILGAEDWFVSAQKSVLIQPNRNGDDIAVIESSNNLFRKYVIDEFWLTGRTWKSLLSKGDRQNNNTFNIERASSRTETTEIILNDQKYKSVCTFSLVDIANNSTNNINMIVQPLAVFTFIGGEIDAFSADQLKYIAPLKNRLLKFFKRNFENDTFGELVRTREGQSVAISLNHALKQNLDMTAKTMHDLSKIYSAEINKVEKEREEVIAKKISDLTDTYNFYHRAVINRIVFPRLHEKYLADKTKAPSLSEYKTKVTKIHLLSLRASLLSIIKKVNDHLYPTIDDFPGYPRINFPDKSVNVCKELIEDAVVEIAVNSRYSYESLKNLKNRPKIELWIDNNKEGKLCLHIKTLDHGVNKMVLRTLKKRYYTDHRGGLSMIATVWNDLFGSKIEIDSVESKYFEVTLPI